MKKRQNLQQHFCNYLAFSIKDKPNSKNIKGTKYKLNPYSVGNRCTLGKQVKVIIVATRFDLNPYHHIITSEAGDKNNRNTVSNELNTTFITNMFD